MAITDQEKQEIIAELLAEIRANGLDYSGQTITFPDAFNITQTERQNVKIPAIDERSATPVHGNVDLEALLTAYGLTEVQEIASDISTNYMKKVADSHLNMADYDIYDIGSLQSNKPTGLARSVYIPVPRMTYSYLGVTSGDYEAFFTAYFKKIAELYSDASRAIFMGAIQANGYGNAITYIHACSDIASNGMPKNVSCFTYSYGGADLLVRTDYNGNLTINSISQYSATDPSKDNRINAMGSNYIRYENGLQICWGETTFTDISFDITRGGMYGCSNITTGVAFPLSFVSKPVVTPVNAGGVGSLVYYIENSATWITHIAFLRHASGTSNVNFAYIAIGKWK